MAAATAAADAVTTAVDPRFEAFLDASTDSELPEEIATQIRAGLTRQYGKPPVAETEAVLQHNCNADRVRQLIYWPSEEDAHLYATLIQSPPPGAPENHPAVRCQVTYLMALYLRHAKDWTFAKQFILAGGLRAMVNLIVVRPIALPVRLHASSHHT